MTTAESGDYYAQLGVSQAASASELRAAYRDRAKAAHPDRAGGSTLLMARLNEAYEILSDPERRRRYDESRRAPVVAGRYRRPATPAPGPDAFAFLSRVFRPVASRMAAAIAAVHDQMDELSGDPFDDQLMEAFEAAVATLARVTTEATRALASAEVPSLWEAAIALYEQGLRQVEDALEEFESFPLNYHLDHLVMGRSLLLGAQEIMEEATDRLASRSPR